MTAIIIIAIMINANSVPFILINIGDTLWLKNFFS